MERDEVLQLFESTGEILMKAITETRVETWTLMKALEKKGILSERDLKSAEAEVRAAMAVNEAADPILARQAEAIRERRRQILGD